MCTIVSEDGALSAVNATTARRFACGSNAWGVAGRNLTITVNDVWVKGLPHNTVVIIRWPATDTFPDGSPYRNHSVHIVLMRWGKIVEIDANEDSEAVANMLTKKAAAGIEEATAPQIVS